jgi:hypothetical protein
MSAQITQIYDKVKLFFRNINLSNLCNSVAMRVC